MSFQGTAPKSQAGGPASLAGAGAENKGPVQELVELLRPGENEIVVVNHVSRSSCSYYNYKTIRIILIDDALKVLKKDGFEVRVIDTSIYA